MLMVGGSGVYRPMRGPQTWVLVETTAGFTLYDGSGRLYRFGSVTGLGNDSLWLLAEVNDGSGLNPMRFEYDVELFGLPGGGQVKELRLSSIEYNEASPGSCSKHRLQFEYGYWAYQGEIVDIENPLVMASWASSGGLRGRASLLTRIDVMAHGDTCGPDAQRQRLWGYRFAYEWDRDTGLPRLALADQVGREGTPEGEQRLPLARFEYGSIADGGLHYAVDQVLPTPNLPTGFDQSVGLSRRHSSGLQYNTLQAVVDVTGDGRADIVGPSSTGGAELVHLPARNASAGALSAPQVSVSSAPRDFLGDSLAQVGTPLTPERFGLRPSNQDVYRQLIDFNGDGRVDLMVSEHQEHWTLYLNTPDPIAPERIIWVEREIPIEGLRADLTSRGLLSPTDSHVPLSRSVVGLDVSYQRHCEIGGTGAINEEANCWDLSPSSFAQKSHELWSLRDVNGDGYPDLARSALPVVRARYRNGPGDGPQTDCALTVTNFMVQPGSSSDASSDPGFQCDMRYDLTFATPETTNAVYPCNGSVETRP